MVRALGRALASSNAIAAGLTLLAGAAVLHFTLMAPRGTGGSGPAVLLPRTGESGSEIEPAAARGLRRGVPGTSDVGGATPVGLGPASSAPSTLHAAVGAGAGHGGLGQPDCLATCRVRCGHPCPSPQLASALPRRHFIPPPLLPRHLASCLAEDVLPGLLALLGVPQGLWGRKVAEFVTQRDRRRALAADRPYIPLTPMGILPLLKAFLFDPFDPEWNCDSKRKIGVPVCVGCLCFFYLAAVGGWSAGVQCVWHCAGVTSTCTHSLQASHQPPPHECLVLPYLAEDPPCTLVPLRANGNDGPKWTCGVHLLHQPCVIFSLGSKGIMDFESEMYKWGQCTIHVFDPTVDASVGPSLRAQVRSHCCELGCSFAPSSTAVP
jgi:hypothetical protein